VRASHLFDRTVNYIFLSLFPVVLIIVTFAHEGLALWLGGDFAVNSSLVLQVLAVGVFINSQAYVPSGLVQGAGRPDLTAKLHLIELPFYLLILWWMLDAYGIVGVAVAWVLRVVVDAVFLFAMAHRLLSPASPLTLRPVLRPGMALFVLALGAVIPGLAMKSVFLLVMLILFVVLAWFVILATDERNMICSRLKTMPTK